MKVLHIGKYYPPFSGGIETVNYDIVEGLRDQGIHTDVLVLNHNKEIHSLDSVNAHLFRENKNFTISSQPFSFSYLKKIFGLVNKYDIVHIHLPNPLATLPFLFIGRKNFKLVLHWHSDIVKQKMLKVLYKPVQKMILEKADVIVTTSANYGSQSLDLQKHQSKIKSIPIGINPQKKNYPSPTLNNLIEQHKDKKIIFALGRLVYYKGFSVLIEAAKKINEDAIIVIGGNGPLKKEFELSIKKNKLENKVFLVGRICDEELNYYFRQCYLFCFPSTEKSEAFGVTQIEAMAYGKPVISTNIIGSGVPWVNKSMISGMTVTPNKAGELADAVNRLLNDPILHSELSNGAEKRYKENFTKEKMVEDFTQLYKDLKKTI